MHLTLLEVSLGHSVWFLCFSLLEFGNESLSEKLHEFVVPKKKPLVSIPSRILPKLPILPPSSSCLGFPVLWSEARFLRAHTLALHAAQHHLDLQARSGSKQNP